MPESTKATIAVPAQDPKKKKPEEKPEEDVKDGASKKKDEEKEGEDLVRVSCVPGNYPPHMSFYTSQKRICS